MTAVPLQQRIAQKIHEVSLIADQLPGVVIIHDVATFSVQYMSKLGLKSIGQRLSDVVRLSSEEYHAKFFNKDDAADYVPKIIDMINRNTDDVVNFFQQVRTSKTQEWDWYLSAIRILLRDYNNSPLLTLTIAMKIDPKHHITSKVSRLLDENNFLRNNFDKFGKLTKREREILKDLALGKTSAQIARHLHISIATAETHRKNIKRKLGIHSSYDLSMYARAFDLI